MRVVGDLSAEANGLIASVVTIGRAGTARQACRSIECRIIDAISLLCCGNDRDVLWQKTMTSGMRLVVVHAHAHAQYLGE